MESMAEKVVVRGVAGASLLVHEHTQAAVACSGIRVKVEEHKQEKPVVDPHNMARDAQGRFLPGQMPATALSRTHDRAVEIGRRGGERRRELAAMHARAEGVKAMQEGGFDAKGPAQAVGMLAGEFAKSALANAMDKPRDAVPAAKLALRLADMLPEERRGAQAAAVVNVTVGGGDTRAIDAEWAEA